MSELLTKTDTPHPNAFGGVPACFRARCREASRGGDCGYKDAGRMLCDHLPCPHSIEDDAWEAEKERLLHIVLDDHTTEADALRWFDSYYPKCMALVPKRRRGQFIEGVYDSVIHAGFN